MSPPRANANLRQRLLRLRRQAGDLVSESAGLLHLHAAVDCDLGPLGCSADAMLHAPLLAGLDVVHDDVEVWLDDDGRTWGWRVRWADDSPRGWSENRGWADSMDEAKAEATR